MHVRLVFITVLSSPVSGIRTNLRMKELPSYGISAPHPSPDRTPYRSATYRINDSSLHDLTTPAPSITALLDLRQFAPGLARIDKGTVVITLTNVESY